MADALLFELGKGLAIDGVKALGKLIMSQASEEVWSAMGDRDQLDKLRRKFEYAGALLEDLSRSNHQVQQIKLLDTWLKRFQDVSYLTDNLMDEYAYEIIRRKLELKYPDSGFTKFRNCFACTPLFFRFRMSFKVRNILKLFDELDAEAKAIGLNQVGIARDAVRENNNGNILYGNCRSLNQTREHVSVGGDSNGFVGRKDDERELLEMLCDSCNEDSSLPTVAIVGMGGLGKTTLARRIYDHQNINTLFGDTKIWICVSQNFDILRLLNEMVEGVTSNKGDLSNKDGIIRKLEDKLKGKRFLLVLDDVWKEDQVLWDSFRESLKRIGGLPGSTILITTRRKKVADAARAVYKHKLEGLSEDDSWELLKQNVDIDDGSCLEEIGRRIVNKCKGVPLAINVIGCLLESKKNSLRDWEVIETSELWELPQGKNDILPSLLLSFNHLPSPSLKQCFASCAIFRKGWILEKDVLIAHWLAQGFLHIPSSETRRLTEEDIGEEFCNILLNNLFLQQHRADENGVLWYTMHDLVYDLAIYLLKEDLLQIKEASDHQKVGDYRHLVVFKCKHDQMVFEFSEPKTLRRLRTISFVGIYCQKWVHARYLRTLVLGTCRLSELPTAIGLLQHLRFLDLSHNPIRMLPETICKLYHLQTLRLRGCNRLINLPSLLNRLVNLRHIFTTTPLYASRGLAELKNLQTLPRLILRSDQGWTIDELGAFPQLRGEICIHGLEHVKNGEQAGKVALYRHDKVMKMALTWARDRDENSEGYADEDVLDRFQPHPAISSIELENFYGKAFPSWIMKMSVVNQEDITRLRPLSNLTMLKLMNCSNCQALPTLGHLPSLSILIMSGLDVEFIGSEFYGNSAEQVFRSLRTLLISFFPRLITWMVPTVEATVIFPRLERLHVENCPLLKTIPALQCESLTHLKLGRLINIESLDIIKGCTGLTSLYMQGMSLLTSLPDELANCRNLQELELECLEQLVYLPSLNSMECLNSLKIYCPALISLPDDFFHGLSALHTLYIMDCKHLKRLPSSFEELTSLQKILISGCDFENVPPANLSMFRKLYFLNIPCSSAVSLRSMLEAVEQLPNMEYIGVEGFKDEQELGEYFSDMTPFLRLQSLKHLLLVGPPEIRVGRPEIRSLPEQLGLFTTRIRGLYLWAFKDLEEIPDWLCNLSSLETLRFVSCHSLRRFPSKEAMLRLTRLRCLTITNCPLLKESYVKDRGPEWHKVEHLSYIEVDGVEIF